MVDTLGLPAKYKPILLKHDIETQDFSRTGQEMPIVVLGNLLAGELGYDSGVASTPNSLASKPAKHLGITDQSFMDEVDQNLKKYFEMVSAAN